MNIQINDSNQGYSLLQKLALIAGPLFLLYTLYSPVPDGLNLQSWRVFGVTVLMAIWWFTEAVPISVTSLLPLFLFPTLGIGKIKDVAIPFANPLIFMFLGGFIIAAAMQRWNLHRRLALSVVALIGTKPSLIVLGFMVSCAFLSMWMNNVTVTLMMAPIAISVAQIIMEKVKQEEEKDFRNFARGLMLGVAYASSIGGLGTLIGSTPNAMTAGFMLENYKQVISFNDWLLIGLPVMLIILPLTWLLLTKLVFRTKNFDITSSHEDIQRERKKLGPMKKEEIQVCVIFFLVAVLWMTQAFISKLITNIEISNATIAMFGALILFLTPVNLKKGEFLLDKKWAKRIDWDVLVLIGGGLSLAKMISDSGLAQTIGNGMKVFGDYPPLLMILIVTTIIVYMTELTSNTAVAATFIPILAAMGIGLGENPLLLILPVSFGASCAFMLPISTPPNAIVYSSGYIRIRDMINAGMAVNIVCILVITAVIYYIATWVFHIELGTLPEWARTTLK